MAAASGVLDEAVAGTTHTSSIWARLLQSIGRISTEVGEKITDDLNAPIEALIVNINKLAGSAARISKVLSVSFSGLINPLGTARKELADLLKGVEEIESKGGSGKSSVSMEDQKSIDAKEISAFLDAEESKKNASELSTKIINDKKKKAADAFSHEMEKLEREQQENIQAIYDADVNAFLEAEDKKKKEADKTAEHILKGVGKMADGMAAHLDKLADNALFKNLDPTFTDRFKEFKGNRDARKEALETDADRAAREAKILAKQERGIKVSSKDAKFLKDLEQFRAAEVLQAKLNAAANEQRKKVVDLLEKNLELSGGPN